MIDTKKPTEYDAAVAVLIDLRPTGPEESDSPSFEQRLQQLREANARKPSLISRLDRAGLDASRAD